MSSNILIPVGSNPFTKQEGGDHYVNMGMQPVLFCTVNCYDASAFSICKYISRWRNKNGTQDLLKARHFVEIRQELLPHIQQPIGNAAAISVERYIAANKIETRDADVLIALHCWVLAEDDGTYFQHADILTNLIDDLIRLA